MFLTLAGMTVGPASDLYLPHLREEKPLDKVKSYQVQWCQHPIADSLALGVSNTTLY